MADEIVWEISLKNALNLSRKESKLVLAAFFGSTCEACIKMKTCTLLTSRVQDYIMLECDHTTERMINIMACRARGIA
jgi:hypothetical protein